MRVARLLVILALVMPHMTLAQERQIEIKDIWARASAGKTDVAAVFMAITSPHPDRLIAASAPIARKTDLMTMEGSSSMKMSYLKAIELPANKAVSLNPAGLHVWLEGLKQPLKEGEAFPLTLTFEKAGKREVTVPVTKASARGPEHRM
jgi:periplasmic copper chaperone A